MISTLQLFFEEGLSLFQLEVTVTTTGTATGTVVNS